VARVARWLWGSKLDAGPPAGAETGLGEQGGRARNGASPEADVADGDFQIRELTLSTTNDNSASSSVGRVGDQQSASCCAPSASFPFIPFESDSLAKMNTGGGGRRRTHNLKFRRCGGLRRLHQIMIEL